MPDLRRPHTRLPPTLGIHRQPQTATVRGKVVKAPDEVGDPMRVSVPGFSKKHAVEIRYWMPRGAGGTPAKGDICLVVVDDQQEPWVVAWEPL